MGIQQLTLDGFSSAAQAGTRRCKVCQKPLSGRQMYYCGEAHKMQYHRYTPGTKTYENRIRNTPKRVTTTHLAHMVEQVLTRLDSLTVAPMPPSPTAHQPVRTLASSSYDLTDSQLEVRQVSDGSAGKGAWNAIISVALLGGDTDSLPDDIRQYGIETGQIKVSTNSKPGAIPMSVSEIHALSEGDLDL